MPGLGGLEVQRSISAKTSIPVIFITGRGDIPSTVTAMKGGAIDFLTKPVDEAALLASVERALQQDRANRREAIDHARLVTRYESLTPREREVLPLLVSGLLNKQAAFELGSPSIRFKFTGDTLCERWKRTLLPLWSSSRPSSNLSRPGRLTGIHKRRFSWISCRSEREDWG